MELYILIAITCVIAFILLKINERLRLLNLQTQTIVGNDALTTLPKRVAEEIARELRTEPTIAGDIAREINWLDLPDKIAVAISHELGISNPDDIAKAVSEEFTRYGGVTSQVSDALEKHLGYEFAPTGPGRSTTVRGHLEQIEKSIEAIQYRVGG